MSRRPFDRVMLDLEAGRSLKLSGLTDSEWRAFIGGVLPIAAKAPFRGCLLVGNRPAGEAEVAAQAGVKITAARSALPKLRDLELLYEDRELECERVHDFEEWNPPPKVDKTAAERQRRYRERLIARNGTVTPPVTRNVTPPLRPGHALVTERDARDVTLGREEKRREGVLTHSSSAAVTAATESEERGEIARLSHLLADLIRQRDPKAKVAPDSKGWRDACRLLLDRDGRSEVEIETAIRWCQADEFWQANVLSMPTLRRQFDRLWAKLNTTSTPKPTDADSERRERTRRRLGLQSIEGGAA